MSGRFDFFSQLMEEEARRLAQIRASEQKPESEVKEPEPIEENTEHKELDFASEKELSEYEEKIYGKQTEKTELDEIDDLYQDIYQEQSNQPQIITRNKLKEKYDNRKVYTVGNRAGLFLSHKKYKIVTPKKKLVLSHNFSNKRFKVGKSTAKLDAILGFSKLIDNAKGFRNGLVTGLAVLGMFAIANRGKRNRLQKKQLGSFAENRKRLSPGKRRLVSNIMGQGKPNLQQQETSPLLQEIVKQDVLPGQLRYNQWYDNTSAQLAASISQYRYGAPMPGYLT